MIETISAGKITVKKRCKRCKEKFYTDTFAVLYCENVKRRTEKNGGKEKMSKKPFEEYPENVKQIIKRIEKFYFNHEAIKQTDFVMALGYLINKYKTKAVEEWLKCHK